MTSVIPKIKHLIDILTIFFLGTVYVTILSIGTVAKAIHKRGRLVSSKVRTALGRPARRSETTN